MEWLHNPEDDSFDPTGDFKKVDQLRPKKAGQKPKDRAEEIEGALYTSYLLLNFKFENKFSVVMMFWGTSLANCQIRYVG